MTNDDLANDVSNERREAVRAQAKKVNARIRRRKIVRRSVITILIVAVVAAAGWWVWRSVAPELEREVVVPQNISEGDGIDVAALMPENERPDTVDDPIQVDVYIDYMSTDAAVIEEQLAPQMYEWLQEGVLTLSYHPVSLLSGESNGTQYSTRAAGAVMCVVSEAPEAFQAFNTELLTNQPEEASGGFTDEQLASKAADAGAEGVEDCIKNRTYAPWVSEATERALSGALEGTDDVQLTDALVVIDGQQYDGSLDDPGEFNQFLLTLQSEEYYGETDSE